MTDSGATCWYECEQCGEAVDEIVMVRPTPSEPLWRYHLRKSEDGSTEQCGPVRVVTE